MQLTERNMVKQRQQKRRAELRARQNSVAARPMAGTIAPAIPAATIERRTTGTYPASNVTERDAAFIRHYYRRFGTKPFDVVTDLSNKIRVPGGGGKNAENDKARIGKYQICRLAVFGLVRCNNRTKRQLTPLGIRVARAGDNWRMVMPATTTRVQVTVPSGDEVLVEIVAEMLTAGGKKAERARESLQPLVRDWRSGTGRDMVAMIRTSPLVGLDLEFPRDKTVTEPVDL